MTGVQLHGCHSRNEYKETLRVQDGYHEYCGEVLARVPRIVEVPFRMSRGCEYKKTDLGKVDKGCEGCSWK